MIKIIPILIFFIASPLITFSQKEMFIRIIKQDMELEVWITDSVEFRLYKKYNICKLSGVLGPKRKQGDLQVPEGFYYINNFNLNSKYHLSLGINYPNESDKILSYYKDPGGLIFSHGLSKLAQS